MNGSMIAGAVSTLICLISAAPAAAQEPLAGQWQIGPDSNGGAQAGRFHLVLSMAESGSSIGLGLGLQELQGLSAAEMSGTDSPVRFHLQRGAGTLVFDGSFRNGRGSGRFAFSPDAGYADALQRRGVGRPTPRQQLSLAVHAVDLAFVDEVVQALAEQGSARPSVSELIKLRRVGASYVRELASLGYRGLSHDQLIRLYNHRVSAEYIRAMQALGYQRVPPEQLVRLRKRHVTPEFVRWANAGRSTPRSTEELVRLRDLDRRR